MNLPETCRYHTVGINPKGYFECPACKKVMDDKEAEGVLIEILGVMGGEFSLKFLGLTKTYFSEWNKLREKISKEAESLKRDYLKTENE